MALVKWSAMVSEVKGKLNGTIFSNPTYGAQMRNRRSCKGHPSNVWGAQQSLLGVVASEWKDLTPTQQQSFLDKVAEYPYINKFGDSVTPSAYQLYCTLNLNRRAVGAGQLTTCLSPNSEANFGAVAMQVGATGELEMTFTNPANANIYAIYYVSPPQSKGVFYQPAKMRYTASNLGNQASPFAIDSSIEALYGPVVDDQKYFWRMEVVDTVTGQRYGSYNGSYIVSGHS